MNANLQLVFLVSNCDIRLVSSLAKMRLTAGKFRVSAVAIVIVVERPVVYHAGNVWMTMLEQSHGGNAM